MAATLTYATLPTGTGSWDTGAGTTLTIFRGLNANGIASGSFTCFLQAGSWDALSYDASNNLAIGAHTGQFASVLVYASGSLGFTVASTGVTAEGPIMTKGAAISGAAGTLSIGSATRTTVGANGAATALTANPLGYLDWYVGGTAVGVPYYNRGA